MADSKDIEIKLKATGGDAAAAEVQKVEAAVEGLQTETTATNEMTPLFEWGKPIETAKKSTEEVTEAVVDLGVTATTTAPAIEELTDAANDMSGSFNLGGQAATQGLGSRLIALAGGPFKIIVAAFAASVAVTRSVMNHLDEIKAAADRSLPSLASTSQAAAVEADALANATALAATNAQAAERAYDAYAKRLRQVTNQQAAATDAELGATLAQIDLDELQGNLSEAEAIQARYAANAAATAKKSAAERAAIETELENRRQQNALDLAKYQDSLAPAQAAAAKVDVITGEDGINKAGGDVRDRIQERNDAIAARAQATTTDKDELDALDEAVAESQQAVIAAYQKAVADAINERNTTAAASAAAGDKYNQGKADEASLSRDLDNLTTGPGAQAAAAAAREAETRLKIEQERLAQDEAARKAKAYEEEQRAASKATGAAVDVEAQTLAAGIESTVAAAPNAGANPELLKTLSSVAALLKNGTDSTELAAVIGQLAGVTEQAVAAGARAESVVAALKAQVANLQSRLGNQ